MEKQQNDQRTSIMKMAKGAFEERVDYEMSRVIDNILDINTSAVAKRKITLTIELAPDASRQRIGVAVQAKATLAPTHPVTTSLCITGDENGEMAVVENVPYTPGQIDVFGDVKESPKILKLAHSAV